MSRGLIAQSTVECRVPYRFRQVRRSASSQRRFSVQPGRNAKVDCEAANDKPQRQ